MQRFSGMQYLMIDIANNYGLDKLSWNERLKWTRDNISNLESFKNKADNPSLYSCAVNALRMAERGEPSGYGIHLDATASGTQWLSILTGDKNAALLCNVLSTGNREDSYTIIFNKMKTKVTESFGSITREQVKKAIMTSLYGSKKKPEELFGDKVNLFEETMEECMPEAWLLNKFLAGPAWNPSVDSYKWVLPDNFHAGFKVKDLVWHTFKFANTEYPFAKKKQMPVEKGRALGANLIHSIDGFIVREMVQRCSIDVSNAKRTLNGETICGSCKDILQCMTLWSLYKESGYLSARILNYIYSNTINLVDRAKIEELVEELPEKTFDILPIHDSFTVLPNYGNDVRQQYIYMMYHMAKSNMLNFLLKQIGIKDTWVKPCDFSDEILNSEYALS